MRSFAILLLGLLAAGPAAAAPAFPDTPNLPNMKGTVDAWTPAMLEKARHAATKAGYRPVAVQFVQDGNVFLTADRGDQVYDLVLTRAGKLYASSGTPEQAAAPAG